MRRGPQGLAVTAIGTIGLAGALGPISVVDRDIPSRAHAAEPVPLIPIHATPVGRCTPAASYEPSISADGRYLAFTSDARNLGRVSGANFLGADVFVHDLRTGRTRLVSRAGGADGKAGNDNSGMPSISPDGRFVSFASAATNLTPDGTPRWNNVYVRDLRRDRVTLASRASGAHGALGDNASNESAISAAGRRVAFTTHANNFGEDDSRNDTDLFVRDLRRRTTTLVSRASGAHGHAGRSSSWLGAISPNGRYVGFGSRSKLSGADRRFTSDAFIRDLRARRTILISRADGRAGKAGDDDSGGAIVSDDGRIAAFSSLAENLASDARTPSVYYPGEPDPEYPIPGYSTGYDVYARNVRAGTTVLVSRSTSGEAADQDSSLVAISGNGRYVAFTTSADNLAGPIDGNASGLFVRDLARRTTTFVATVPGFRDSFAGGFSHDGRFLTYPAERGIQVVDLSTGRAVDITAGACARMNAT